jgi:hypothetical protein
MTEIKTRSIILILSHIAQCSLGREINGRDFCGLCDMRFREDRQPAIGALVALSSAPASKWYLSWVHGIDPHPNRFSTKYTLESIEDGELCDWANVSPWAYDKSQTDSHPEWRWTDAQHAFYDRWRKVCYGDRDAYITKPCQPVFEDDGSVTLSTRNHAAFSEHRSTKSFPNW